MATRKQDCTTSEFYCTHCGKRGIPIARKIGQQREAGHLKRLFCLFCQQETNHAEIRPFGSYTLDDFYEEFELGRFVDGHKIAVADLLSCSKTTCEYNRSGKCWNATNDYDCGHRIIQET